MNKSDSLVIRAVQGLGYTVDGDLTFATINAQTAEQLQGLGKQARVIIDLAQVDNADSAGLALLIEWQKKARYQQTELQFKNIPPQLKKLAALSGFNRLQDITEASDSAEAE
ncbi:MAG: STAS domain-containing protein [Methylococcales bacterium]|nr:STAS domain-containing protein [Methylococcales bacterium]